MNEKKKILIVDDEEIQLTTAELFLKSEYDVFKMKSGKEAIEYISENKFIPHLIMLDIVMPNMTGWDVLNKIKQIDFLANVPIIFVSSIMEENEIKRAYKNGVSDYITKPYNMTDLKSRIKTVIDKKDTKNARK